MSINFRVFRRNNKNIILLWNAGALPDNCRDSVSVHISRSPSLTEDGSEMDEYYPVEFSRFLPESPEKFAKDVDGVVISHSKNNIDPTALCVAKVVFGEDEDAIEIYKEIKPANSSPSENIGTQQFSGKDLRLHGYDYRNNKWVPFPVDPKLLPGTEG
jgi:hypothetical protein